MKKYLRSTEVAEQLGVSIKTVQGWIREGELPGGKIGGKYFVSAEALEERLSSATVRDCK